MNTRVLGKYRYSVEKYAGRVFCGNGLFETMEEVLEFADDGFCTRAIVYDHDVTPRKKEVIRFKNPEVKTYA